MDGAVGLNDPSVEFAFEFWAIKLAGDGVGDDCGVLRFGGGFDAV